MLMKLTLSAAARTILEGAAAHDSHLATLPERLPFAAQQVVVRSLLKAGLLEELTADDEQTAWRRAEDGIRYVLRATEAGLQAVGVAGPSTADDNAPIALINDGTRPLEDAGPDETVTPAPASTRLARRTAAEAVLSAWDDPVEDRPALPAAIAALRAALTKPVRRLPTGLRQPRSGTKRTLILGLLRRPEGATVAQVVDSTGWARHTVHGFFAGLKKGGTPVEVLERVRQVGPGKQGAAGSYTVYHVAEVG